MAYQRPCDAFNIMQECAPGLACSGKPGQAVPQEGCTGFTAPRNPQMQLVYGVTSRKLYGPPPRPWRVLARIRHLAHPCVRRCCVVSSPHIPEKAACFWIDMQLLVAIVLAAPSTSKNISYLFTTPTTLLPSKNEADLWCVRIRHQWATRI